MHLEESRRVSSSYVFISNASNLPQFGQITKLIYHVFMGRDTTFADITPFGTAKYDAELGMWFVTHNLEQEHQYHNCM